MTAEQRPSTPQDQKPMDAFEYAYSWADRAESGEVTLAQAAQEFEDALRNTGRFAWVAITQSGDELGRTWTNIHVLERADEAEKDWSNTTEEELRAADIEVPFLLLSTIYEKETGQPSNLYFMDQRKTSIDEARAYLSSPDEDFPGRHIVTEITFDPPAPDNRADPGLSNPQPTI